MAGAGKDVCMHVTKPDLWIGSYLAFRGRIERERWTDQAKELAAGSNTKFFPGANVRKMATPKDRGRPAQG